MVASYIFIELSHEKHNFCSYKIKAVGKNSNQQDIKKATSVHTEVSE